MDHIDDVQDDPTHKPGCGALNYVIEPDYPGQTHPCTCTDWRSRALAAETERDALKAEVEQLKHELKQMELSRTMWRNFAGETRRTVIVGHQT